MRSPCLGTLLAALLLVAAGRADAITIVVTGNDGSSGIIGLDGGPGDPADATASSPDAVNSATAQGGRGGDGGAGGAPASGGDGGAASALAETNVAAPASALATASGGDGGHAVGAGESAGDGGAAAAEARADGSGGSEARALAAGGRGGDGTIGALGGDGGDAVLNDAVSGSDPVALLLEQSATGGARGAVGAQDGDAVSTGDFDNAAGGDLHVLLAATGGNAHVGGSATSSGAGDAVLEAVARGSGALVLDPLLAHATGSGDATASVEAEQLGDGASLSLVNQVDAFADGGGAVSLRQSAIAEGAAESSLDVTKSTALLDLEANAEGGEASILVRGSNDAGDLRMSGEARGAADFDDPIPHDAHAVFEATTTGDGHDIEIGLPGRPASAVGTDADRPREGGTGRIEARADALGNSAVRIDVLAEGGDGDDFHGGDAFASAEGRGGGTESVDVVATALGRGFYGVGGDASAQALAMGAGAVHARAIAHGGIQSATLGSGAFARAQGIGSGGTVEAVASTSLLFSGEQSDDEQVGRITVSLAAPVAGDVALAASSHMAGFAQATEDPTLGASIRSAYQPEASLLQEALDGNARAAAAPPPTPRLFALVELEASSGGGVAQTFSADIVLADPFGGFGEFDPKPEAVLISFLDPEIDAAAFGSLTLRSWDLRNPSDVYEIVFANALDAIAFLDDGRLLFGGVPRARHLEIILETTGAEGEFFLDLVVAAVPEPSLVALLVLALLAAALGHRVVASRPS